MAAFAGLQARMIKEGDMRNMRFALAVVAAMIATPSAAQNAVIECAKATGGIQIPTSDRRQFRWYFPSESLTARFNDCVARKAAPAPIPPARATLKRSR